MGLIEGVLTAVVVFLILHEYRINKAEQHLRYLDEQERNRITTTPPNKGKD